MDNPDKISDRNLKLLSHIVNVQQVWNNRINYKELKYKPWDIHPIEEILSINQNNIKESLKIITELDIDQFIDYTLSNGQQFRHTIRDILFHVINHSSYHRGQVATEFKVQGLEPLMTDYIYYKMTNVGM